MDESIKNEFEIEKVLDGTFSSIYDTSMDFMEMGIDELLDEGVMKEIPIVKTIYSIVNTGVNIRNKIFAEKLLIFIKAVKLGIASEKQKAKFRIKMEDKHYKEQVGEFIFSLLDKFNEFKKANILGRIYLKHVNECYDYNTFIELANCLQELLVTDLEALKFFYDNKHKKYYLASNTKINENNQLVLINSINRLHKSNLIISTSSILWNELENPTENMRNDGYFQLANDRAVKISEFGILFYESI